MNEKVKTSKINAGDPCPECGEPKSRHELMCRECYKRSGGLGPGVHDSIFETEESSDPKRIQRRA
jgi:hypothetical protein